MFWWTANESLARHQPLSRRVLSRLPRRRCACIILLADQDVAPSPRAAVDDVIMSEMRRETFIQHLLSDVQLRAGLLAAVDDVAIPDEPLAMMTLRVSELSQLAGISFQESFDDLDRCFVAVLRFARGFSVTLKEHPRAPVQGVVIYTEPAAVSSGRLHEILSGLGLTADLLTWTVPEAADSAEPA